MAPFRRTVLPDGFEVITAATPGARSVSIGAWLDVGSRDEADDEAGAAHLVEHLVFKGTDAFSAREIAERFDAIGGELNAFTTKEATCFHARVLTKDLPMTVDVLGDLVMRPRLDEADIEVERQVVLEEIAMHEDTPEDLVGDLLCEAMLPKASVGRRIQGFASTIEAMPAARIVEFQRRHYGSARAVLAACGAVDHDRLVVQASVAFAGIGHRASVRDDYPAAFAPGVRAIATRDIEQAHLTLGVPGLARRDERRWAMAIVNAALGAGMSSRLFQQIREERGLAYHVASGNQGFSNAGVFSIYAGCAPERLAEVADLARDIVADVAINGITDGELERARGFLRGGMLLGFEDHGGLMTHLGKSALLHDEVLTPDQLLARLDAVTLEDCRIVADAVFGSNPWSVAVVGPDDDPAVRGFDLSEQAA